MRFLTDFADQAVVLPALGLVCTTLLLIGWRRAAVVLAGSSLGVGAIVAIGKILFIACPGLVANRWGLQSPSGHTAMAVAFYGGLVALPLAKGRALWRTLPLAVLVAAAVGASRLVLGYHSLADVVAGTAIGVTGVCVIAACAGPCPATAARRWEVLPLALSVALLFHGQHLRAEEMLQDYASRISAPASCRAPSVAGLTGPDTIGELGARPTSH